MVAPGDLGTLDTALMTWSLGVDMMARGRDATGIYTATSNGRWKVRKKNRRADLFLAGREGIGENAQTIILHTRHATQGDPRNNLNNHPIQSGSIIGVHNGMLANDDALFAHFKEWERRAEVDSEAIFAAINNLDLYDAFKNLDGSWAIAWADVEDDPRRIWLARGSSSPLCVATTENGSVVFASTMSAVDDALKLAGVTGKTNTVYTQEGFAAATDPVNGGLIVLDKFDGSGKEAIGARPPRNYTYTHGEDWEYGGSFRPGGQYAQQQAASGTTTSAPSGPRPGERIWMSGNRQFPKVGDRRKYWSTTGKWIFEICCSAAEKSGDPGTWKMLTDTPEVTGGTVVQIDRKTTPATPLPAAVPPPGPDDDDEWGSEGVFGFAEPGDIIQIHADNGFGNPDVMICGKVVDVDKDTSGRRAGEKLHVHWMPSVIDTMADYRIIGKFKIDPVKEEGASV